jgi:hypothetical protein
MGTHTFSLLVIWMLAACGPFPDKIAEVSAEKVFATQCRFDDGSKAILTRRTEASNWIIIYRTAEGGNDYSEVTLGASGQVSIETNGGIEKYTAIMRVYNILRNLPGAYVGRAEFESLQSSEATERCGFRSLFDGVGDEIGATIATKSS